MKTINNNRAKEICRHWHGGQWSSFYQFASSGKFHIPNVLRYFQEVEENLHAHEYALHPYHLSKKNEKELLSLKNYFLKLAEQNQVPVEFEKHDLYGYLIPYLKDDVSESLTNQVIPVKYLP